jgi:hypothetical protein
MPYVLLRSTAKWQLTWAWDRCAADVRLPAGTKYSSPPTPCPDRLWGRVQRPILWSPRLLRRKVKWPQCKTHHNSIQFRGCECFEHHIRSHYMTSLVAWPTLHLRFADNYIATTCSLQPHLYCVLILLQGLAAFHEFVWLCKERRIK